MTSSRVLVLTQGYPGPNAPYNMAYIHTRLLGYIERGIEVYVLNFSAHEDYIYESIPVITEKTWRKEKQHYDVLIAHAPNLRNHLRFLQKYGNLFAQWLFFLHGHEVLYKQNYYPRPYPYDVKKSIFWQCVDNAYDLFKLQVLRIMLKKWLQKGHLKLIFVSEWMRTAFLENVKLDEKWIEHHSYIIPNAVNPQFLKHTWHPKELPSADCITIRPLDNSKYAIDQVCALARSNPKLRFHIFGKGEYFNHYVMPQNVVWYDRFLTPREMVSLLPNYRCAVMPTRLDAQGVMMCELASYGIPLITSDLPICREMLGAFSRVHYLKSSEENIGHIIQDISKKAPPHQQPFAFDTLIDQECELIQSQSEQKP